MRQVDPTNARRRRRWPGRLVLVLALLVATGLGVRYRAAARASRVLGDLAKQKAPTTFGQILDIYQAPARDATELWMTALDKVESIGDGDVETLRQLPYVGFADAPTSAVWPNVEKAEAYLHDRSEAIKLLHSAAESGGGARYPVEAASGFYGFLPPDGLIDASQLLRLEANLSAFRGDSRRCAAALSASQSLANSLANSPDGPSQTVSRAIYALALEDIAKHFALGFSNDELLQFQSQVRAARADRALVLECLAQRARGIAEFENSAAAEGHIDAYNQLLSLPQVEHPRRMLGLESIRARERVAWKFFRPWDYLLFLNTSNQLVRASQSEWPQAIDAAAAAEKVLGASLRSETIGGRYLLTRMLINSPRRQFEAAARHAARLRVFDAAIAVELYRRRNGGLPPSLEVLAPEYLAEVPADPFSGEPIRYAPGDGHFVCYSVGVDRVDDSGDGGRFGTEPDIAVRYSSNSD